jgi:hypothetical protein
MTDLEPDPPASPPPPAEPDDRRPGPDRWIARPVVRIAERNIVIAGGVAATLLAVGFWFVIARLPDLLGTPERADPPRAEAQPSADARKIQATLFYLSDTGDELAGATQEVLYGATPAEQARRIVEAMLQAPGAGRRSAVPAGTAIRSLFVTAEGHVYLDLTGAIVSGHPGGSLQEALTVYAIVNAITVNLPNVTAVQILVDGRQVDTLVGHLDLWYPLGKALDWVRKGS